MAKEEVLIGVKVDTKQAQKSLGALEKDIDGVDGSLKDVGKTVKKGEISKGLNEASGAATALGGSMGAAVGGVKSLTTAFKVLKAAAVPLLIIAAIVATVTALFKAFTSTKKGAEQLQAVTAGLGAVMDVLRDILVDVAEVLISVFKDPKQAVIDLADTIQNYFIKQIKLVTEGLGLLGSAMSKLFEGDFSGALDDAAEGAKKLFIETNPLIQATNALATAFKETTDEIIKETNAAYNLSLQMAALRLIQKENYLKKRANANRLLSRS